MNTQKAIGRFQLSFALCLLMLSHARTQWIAPPGFSPSNVRAFAVYGTNLFAGTEADGVFLSSDDGASWAPLNTGLGYLRVFAFSFFGTNLFAGVYDGGVFRSTDNGSGWSVTGLEATTVWCLAVSGTNLLAGTAADGIFVSTDIGASWSARNNGLTYDIMFQRYYDVVGLGTSGSNLLAATNAGVYLSPDNGASWTFVSVDSLKTIYVNTFATSRENIFAGSFGWGVYRSTDYGVNWAEVNTGLTNKFVSTLAVFGTNLFAGTNSGVFLSSNEGASWSEVDSGLVYPGISSLAVSGTNLFAGTGGGVWRRPLSEMITAVTPGPRTLPGQSRLGQNYPNPFNPTTSITYALPASANVRLSVYNMLGQEVATLVNESQQPGYKSVSFDASRLPSGMYTYRITAGTFTDVKKMVLIK